MPRPAVLFAPASQTSMLRGLQTLADLLALTLGPCQGGIIASRAIGQPLEWLTDAATIARRFLDLPNRAENVGAMLLRNLVWRLHLSVGDGCATAAVLAHALLTEALRYRAAGADAALLRRGIEAATATALDELSRMARLPDGDVELEQVAITMTGERRLGLLLAEIVDLLGPNASVTVEEYVAPYLEREYHEGGRWSARLASPHLINDHTRQRAVLGQCAVALFAGELSDAAEVCPLLELVAAREPPRLLLAAQTIRGKALTTLVLNQQRSALQVAAVELRNTGEQLANDFDDLAALTSARVCRALTERLRTITPEALGSAVRVEAAADGLVVVGCGDGPGLRAQIEALEQRRHALPDVEHEARSTLEARLGQLTGNTATLKIGAIHKIERQALRQQAERSIRALRSASREGVVPGGGVAYLNCIPAVQHLALEGDAAYGAAAVARALEAPFRQIVTNARLRDPAAVLAETRRLGPGWGYDALRDAVVEVEHAGLLDPVDVAREALRVAASGATMALTTDALVLKRAPQTSMEP